MREYINIDQQIHQLCQIIAKANRTFGDGWEGAILSLEYLNELPTSEVEKAVNTFIRETTSWYLC